MTVPLWILGGLSLAGGLLGIPNWNFLETWLHPVIPHLEEIHGIIEIPWITEISIALFSTLVAIGGWWFARSRYLIPQLAGDEGLAHNAPGLTKALENKWYVDEAYDAAVVTPLHQLSIFFWRGIDALIDSTLALLGHLVAAAGDLLRFVQTGNVRNYALMFFAAIVIFMWVFA